MAQIDRDLLVDKIQAAIQIGDSDYLRRVLKSGKAGSKDNQKKLMT